MTEAQAREVFDATLAGEKDQDRIAKVELMREFFCNPAFRSALQAEVARINGVAA